MRHVHLVLTLAMLLLIGKHAPPAEAVKARSALLNGSVSKEYDQVHAKVATLTRDRSRAYEGRASARARFFGGANGFARGIFNIRWPEGRHIWFGAAYFIPKGFAKSLQGQVDILRWDNYGALGEYNDRSGVVIHRDGRANLMRMKFGVENVDIGRSFKLPEGRWFWLEVHQYLDRRHGQARSSVHIDDKLVSSSRRANMYGTAVDRVRFGLVAVDAARQTNPLTLWFDRTSVSTHRRGAIEGKTGARRRATSGDG